MFGTSRTVPSRCQSIPVRRRRSPASPIGSTPAVLEGLAQGLGELEGHRLRAAPARRLAARAPSTVDPPSVTTAWIFVPPRSRPPFILCHGSHRTTSPIGLRFARALHSSALCRSGSRGLRVAERQDDHRRLILCRVERPAGDARGPRPRSGTTRRPPPRRRGACSAPPYRHRTTPGPRRARGPPRRAPRCRTFSGTYTAAASCSTRGTSRWDDERPGLGIARRPRESPRIEEPEHELGVSGSGSVRRSSRRLAIASSVSTFSAYRLKRDGKIRRPAACWD